MRGRRSTALAMAVLLGAGALGACSDDGGDDAADDTPAATVDDGDTGTDTGTDETDETDGTTAPDDGSEDTGDTLPAGSFAEGCAQFGEAFTALTASFAGEIDEAALAEVDETIAQAPESVRGDLETYIDAYRQYVQALEETGIDPANPPADASDEDIEQIAAAAEVFSSEEFLASTQSIQEFIASDCAG